MYVWGNKNTNYLCMMFLFHMIRWRMSIEIVMLLLLRSFPPFISMNEISCYDVFTRATVPTLVALRVTAMAVVCDGDVNVTSAILSAGLTCWCHHHDTLHRTDGCRAVNVVLNIYFFLHRGYLFGWYVEPPGSKEKHHRAQFASQRQDPHVSGLFCLEGQQSTC